MLSDDELNRIQGAMYAGDKTRSPEDDVWKLFAEVQRLKRELFSVERASQRNADAHMYEYRRRKAAEATIERLLGDTE